MLRLTPLILTATTFLAGCSADLFPALDSRIDEAPLNAESRSALRDYFNKPNAKAFVFSEETGENWHAWGYGSVDEAEAISLAKCEELTGTRCMTFARNGEIVWQSGSSEAVSVDEGAGSTQSQTTSVVNMRSGPGTGFSIAAVLPRGEMVEVTGSEGIWQAVRRSDGGVGFVHGDYLRPVAQVATTPASTTRLSGSELRALRQDAEAGSTEAQFNLGNRYLHAFGVPKDVIEARQWFTQAAEGGHPVAAYELGLIYETGNGVEVDNATAQRWFRRGADAGHGPSRAKLR